MKNYIIILIIIGLAYSCKHEDDPCKYASVLIDTTLTLTFKINNQERKLYQSYPLHTNGADYGAGFWQINEDTLIMAMGMQINFVSQDTDDEDFKSGLSLQFIKKTVHNPERIEIKRVNLYDYFSDLSGYNGLYGYPYDSENLNDTMFIDGIAMEINNLDSIINYPYTPSTLNVMEYYKWNRDSINSFIKGSYIKVSKVEEVCDNIFLIEGIFQIKLMFPPSTPDTIELTDGKFKFIRHY